MQKRTSERGSQASNKKTTVPELTNIQRDDIEMVDASGFARGMDESDTEEEQLLSASSGENMESMLPVEIESNKPPENSAEAAMTKIQGSAHEGTGTSISSQIQKIIARELGTPAKKGKIDLQSVPLKEYLEQTVIPIIHQGLFALARERPVSPIEYLAAYFLKHKYKYQGEHDHDQTMYGNMDMEVDKSDEIGAAPGNSLPNQSKGPVETTQPMSIETALN